jgi:hypothetical protein
MCHNFSDVIRDLSGGAAKLISRLHFPVRTMVATTTATSSTATTAAAPSLNVYKKVAVIRLPSDSLTYEDSEGKPKSVSVEELGDAISSAVRRRAQTGADCSFSARVRV